MFDWKFAYAPNYICKSMEISTIGDIEKSGFDTISAQVPGNFELDLMRAGKLPDLYYSTNTLEAQKLENMHIWYYTEFELGDADSYLHFEGIDTISEIFVNGELVCETDNMFIPYDVCDGLKQGKNELVIHIKPVCIEARKYTSTAQQHGLKHNYASQYIRKAAHMFGWDIMPRIVSAGIWKPVTVRKTKKDKLNEVYLTTLRIDSENGTAEMIGFVNADVSEDFITDYSVKICGKCGESKFETHQTLWHNSYRFSFGIENCKFWYPKNYGEPNLYETTVELYCKNELRDTYKLNIGIRTVELDISSTESEDNIGDFCFRINGKRVFLMGTNHVPLDAFHSQDTKRLSKMLELTDDIGCNAVRMWGGNVYESDDFYDFCDKHGILVWQDFMMACSMYPQDREFANRFEKEATYQIKRLRNHASLALWAGDNECDSGAVWNSTGNPNDNTITRELLKRLTASHDFTRPYLPSSPYVDETAYKNGFTLPEDHLWGPRDYFKGDFYINAKSRFASETGYQGFPSRKSMEKFLENPEKIFKDGTNIPTDEYLVHAASPETDEKSPYAYRIGLTYSQILKLFDKTEENFDDLLKQSQISQAEAKKFFIERMRMKKWECTGIIWWNLLDGWPQISDAVVDYYFCKKLAYNYIKRSQNPLCLMFGEPQDKKIRLYAVNDLQRDCEVKYKVTEMYGGIVAAQGCKTAAADSSVIFDYIDVDENDRKFYFIEWECGGEKHKNHYCTNLCGINYEKYCEAMKKCGFDEFEGF